MKIYYANMWGAKGLEEYLDFKIRVLAAYPSLKSSKEGVTKPGFCSHLFLDSGAFGKNKNIVLEEYCDFISINKKVISIYANLDAIGDPATSWKNQKLMEKKGLGPLPVFHYGSSFSWLSKLLSKYDYIALGGLVPISQNKQLMYSYLEKVWQVIGKEAPDIKVHGFGVNNLSLMSKFPWYSVDASSVHVMARYGGIYTPWGTLKINPKVNSREMSWQVMRPSELKIIKDFAKKYMPSFSFEECQEQTTKGVLLRCAISICFMEDFVNNLSLNPPKLPVMQSNKLF